MNIYTENLEKNRANYHPLTPVTFLARSARVFPEKTAIVHGELKYTYNDLYNRSRRLAHALTKRGIGIGDTVAIMSPNTPWMLECHYGVPMCGAVLNALNYRLDSASIAFILEHGGAKILFTDREYSPVIAEALKIYNAPITVIDIDDSLAESGELIGETDYESFIADGSPDFDWLVPEDEWQAICLNYTSGTTGNPKGVVFHHRGAYINALGNALVFQLNSSSKYLWTLPMFHCNGWTFTWAVTAISGTHVCLRNVEPGQIFASIRDNQVTHMCGAPIVLNMLIHAPPESRIKLDRTVEVATGGAAPPSAVISSMEKMGFRVTHLYGLTESYGPATGCAWQESWNELDLAERAAHMAKQGIHYPTQQDATVIDPETMQPVPHDGETLGELMMRGNTIMRGYLKNEKATKEAFHGGWYHTGDLGVVHPDNYIEVRDRSKDIIISGGENISSLEVEEVLYKHPGIMEAAVVARPDEKWGETPCAFVTCATGYEDTLTNEEIISWCRDNMAHYKVPKTVVFGTLPKTSTGKIQKFLLREQAKDLP